METSALRSPWSSRSVFYDWREGYQCHYTRLDRESEGSGKVTGAPVVLLPGFGVASFQYEALMQELASLGGEQRVYAIDWFGQGKSWPTRDPAPSENATTEAGFEWGFGQKASPGYENLRYSCDNWTAQLEHFLETQLHDGENGDNGPPKKAVLVGNSLGGLIAANLAATRPELVEGLVFLNATPFWGANRPNSPVWQGDLPVPPAFKWIAAQWWNSIRTTETITTMLDFVYANKDYDKSIIPKIQEPTRAPGSAAAFCSILFSPPTAMKFDAMLIRIRHAKVPVMLCYGREDPWVVPAWGQKAKRDIGDMCVYYEVSPSGHCPHHETPRPVAYAVQEFCSALTALQQEGVELSDSMPTGDTHFGDIVLTHRPKGSPRNVFEVFAYGVYCVEKYVFKKREWENVAP